MIASSMTPSEVYDTSLSPETTYNIPDSCQVAMPTAKQERRDTYNDIIIPVAAANYIMGHALNAFVSTSSIEDMENTLICDGGATCTLTKSLENYTLCKPKVIEVQTAHGMTLMKTTHLSYKTYFVWNRLGEVLRKIVKLLSMCGTWTEI